MVDPDLKRVVDRVATKRDVGRALFWFHVVFYIVLAGLLSFL